VDQSILAARKQAAMRTIEGTLNNILAKLGLPARPFPQVQDPALRGLRQLEAIALALAEIEVAIAGVGQTIVISVAAAADEAVAERKAEKIAPKSGRKRG
jgi:hypothetical protein